MDPLHGAPPPRLGRTPGLAALLPVLLAACGGEPPARHATPARPGSHDSGFRLESSAFAGGAAMPRELTCQGADRSPELRWSGAPPGTGSYALVCEDPDAPGGTWVHWVIYDIPARVTGLPAGLPADAEVSDPPGTRQGRNGFARSGWSGPCPPAGPPHRYRFRLLAVDAVLGLPPGRTHEQLLAAVEGHLLAEATLEGTYKRE